MPLFINKGALRRPCQRQASGQACSPLLMRTGRACPVIGDLSLQGERVEKRGFGGFSIEIATSLRSSQWQGGEHAKRAEKEGNSRQRRTRMNCPYSGSAGFCWRGQADRQACTLCPHIYPMAENGGIIQSAFLGGFWNLFLDKWTFVHYINMEWVLALKVETR